MHNFKRAIPYISLGLANVMLFIATRIVDTTEIKDLLISLFTSGLFFFVVYLFYDLIREWIIRKEKKYLNNYIKNRIANDIFVTLYYLKKVIHGYNLDTNTLENILGTINYSRKEIENSIKNQNYLGFQILKNMDELRDLFSGVLNDNLILKYSTHNDSINILRINNNLYRLEIILKNLNNYNKCAESGIEYSVINGKSLNPENDEKYLLVKKTKHQDRFVVYDSGFFDDGDIDKILNRFVLKNDSAKEISYLICETFGLMKKWIPGVVDLYQRENRFRVIKNFFSPETRLNTNKTKIFVADIVESKNKSTQHKI